MNTITFSLLLKLLQRYLRAHSSLYKLLQLGISWHVHYNKYSINRSRNMASVSITLCKFVVFSSISKIQYFLKFSWPVLSIHEHKTYPSALRIIIRNNEKGNGVFGFPLQCFYFTGTIGIFCDLEFHNVIIGSLSQTIFQPLISKQKAHENFIFPATYKIQAARLSTESG